MLVIIVYMGKAIAVDTHYISVTDFRYDNHLTANPVLALFNTTQGILLLELDINSIFVFQ